MEPHPANLQLGATVGDYQILSVIGRGGMGKVFKVRNVISDRVEAMKVLLPDLDPSPDLVERFLREIKVVAALEHPGIASLRTALRIDNRLLMILEYVEGCSLQAILHRGKIEVGRAISFTRQALDALGYAHRRGVVHRDVKPSNILVAPDDRIKLTDFGIASRSGDPKLTGAGIALGSLHYMSPEQMKAETPDARSDLYSVGVTLFEMITGQPPVQGNSFYAILRAHLEQKPRPALELAPEIGPELSGIIEKSLEKNPEARFQSAEEFQAELGRVGFEATTPPGATSMFQARPRSDTPVPAELAAPPHTPPPQRSTPPAGTPKSDTGSKSWDPAILENARKSLAVYVGPMAKVLVSRAAKTARTSEELYRALAEEISAPHDREKFLRSQHL